MKATLIMLALVLAGLTARSTSVQAKAYFAPKAKMVRAAEIIAVVDISAVKELSPTKSCELQRVEARVITLIKGRASKRIIFEVPCFFPCAITKVKPGLYLVLLAKKGGILQGTNWHLSYRPITGSNVEWYSAKGSSSDPLVTRNLNSVIAEIKQLTRRRR